MFSVIKQFYDIFTTKERRAILILFFPMTIAAIVNVIGIAFVVPFIAIVSTPDTIKTHGKIAWLYHALRFTNEHAFLIFLGATVLAVLIIGNGISALTTWLMLRFTNMRSFTLSKRLLEKYLQQPYVYFLDKNSAVLTKNILSEVEMVVSYVLRHCLEMAAKCVAMFFIITLLFIVNPFLAVGIIMILGGAYTAIYTGVRRRLGEVSRVHTEAKEQRYRIAHETFGGIKEIKLQGCEKVFLDAFAKPANRFAQHEATGQIISDLPRYALEVIAFGGIVLIILYLLATHHPLEELMPLLAMYAFAGYRLMPGLQSIFGALTSIKSHADALTVLHQDLTAHQETITPIATSSNKKITLAKNINLNNIQFVYPNSEKIILNNLTISIGAGESIGIVGETGAGKTTIVDIILGLLQPTAGNIIVDDVVITPNNIHLWQKNLGYVPQHIYLSDESVAQNIAFGLEENKIDFSRVENAAKLAAIHEFIVNELPSGYKTTVGERGVRLSGGQRQRLGIARALYRDPQLLVFDEATSALDSVTEENIMSSIYHLSRKKTLIIIAHRISTLMSCDKIIVLEKGAVQDVGSYDELMSRNVHFQRLAKVIA